MKKHLILVTLFLLTLGGITSAAIAGPVVLVGSNYSVYIEGELSDNAFSAVGPFDMAPKLFSRAGLNLILDESDTDLGAGKNRITIDLVADGDLFTSSGEEALLGVGTEQEGLTLLSAVSLDDARIRLFDSVGNQLFATANLASFAPMGKPWDGFFPAPNAAIGIGNAGGAGVSHVRFEFDVSQVPAHVPEPGGQMLFGMALIVLVGARRRRTGRSAA